MVERATDGPCAAVVVGLGDRPPVGGHLGVWQRIAEAAAKEDGDLALELLLLRRRGRERLTQLAPKVRIHRLPALCDSDRLPFARTAAGGTELFSPSPFLYRRLTRLRPDVVVISDPFGFGRTAAAWARRNGAGLIYAVQTRHDVFARIYTRTILARVLGGRWAQALDARLGLAARIGARTARRIARLMDASDHLFASSHREQALLAQERPQQSVGLLRRGVDFRRFAPERGDRAWLAERFAIAPGRVIALFAGRVDETKGVPLLLAAMEKALPDAPDLHLIIAGDGALRKKAVETLGARVTAPGALDQDVLARVMAAADFFVFPSASDAAANVLREAQASGLATLVCAGEAVAELVATPGLDGYLLPPGDPTAWAKAIMKEAALPRQVREARRARIALLARRRYPDWHAVWREDLLPVFRRLARRR